MVQHRCFLGLGPSCVGLLLLALIGKAGAVPLPYLYDPFPDIYPGGERPKHFATAAVYTGNPAKVRSLRTLLLYR
jgi:hypothetical protein